MKQKASPPLPQHPFVSAKTIHILFPKLPLDRLTIHDGLYDPIEALDLAEELGLRRKTNTEFHC